MAQPSQVQTMSRIVLCGWGCWSYQGSQLLSAWFLEPPMYNWVNLKRSGFLIELSPSHCRRHSTATFTYQPQLNDRSKLLSQKAMYPFFAALASVVCIQIINHKDPYRAGHWKSVGIPQSHQPQTPFSDGIGHWLYHINQNQSHV